jgi:DNA primase
MTGRIRAEDIAEVRARVRIDEVIGEHVTLKSAGGGSLKGLCPFHDERSPSFHVTPSKGLYHCFGCQAGGDAIAFLMQLQGLSFAEAVERLAGRAGVQLRYEEGGGPADREVGQRARLVAANAAAARLYRAGFLAGQGDAARQLMARRGFDDAACEAFSVGYAPGGWDGLTKQLRREGFEEEVLLAAGLVVRGNRGVYDRFRDRLIWPIRDLTGDVVGFGARRMNDEQDGPKYLNTPETLLYKKSQVLYGIDLARKTIARSQQVVVVEGYTDVMAAHLAGATNAVATCGTAFGAEHIGVLRRLLLDDAGSRGEVIFTFDSDAAGQKAALRAFDSDQQFATATYVAVEPSGLDPADLRLKHGDQAVRDLIASRVPLFEFALRSAVAGVDVSTAEGRLAGLRRAAPIIAGIRDRSLRPEYARIAAGWLGLPESTVTAELRNQRGGRGGAPVERRPGGGLPAGLERDALRGILALPVEAGPWLASVEPSAFDVADYRRCYELLVEVGAPLDDESPAAWLERVLQGAPDDGTRRLLRALAVEPMPMLSGGGDASDAADEPTVRYVVSLLARLLDRDAARRLDSLTARLSQPAAAASDAVRRDLQEQYRAVAALRQQLSPFITSEAQV